MNNDLVSIIMPSYNTGEYIKKSIESVIAQTYTNWELIIVDDCSTDNTDDAVRPYLSDSRIFYLKNDKNSGAAVSRNKALREAKGRWIAFLDSDDLWLPQKLEMQIDFMERNGYCFSYTDYRILWDGKTEDPHIYTGPNVVNRKKMYRYCYFSTITVMYDRNVIGLVQIADIKKNNDYAMWLQIIEKADCYRLPESLSYYCRHDNSISSGSKFKLIKHHYIMFRKALNKSPIVSAAYTIRNLFFGVIKKLYYTKQISLEEKV